MVLTLNVFLNACGQSLMGAVVFECYLNFTVCDMRLFFFKELLEIPVNPKCATVKMEKEERKS